MQRSCDRKDRKPFMTYSFAARSLSIQLLSLKFSIFKLTYLEHHQMFLEPFGIGKCWIFVLAIHEGSSDICRIHIHPNSQVYIPIPRCTYSKITKKPWEIELPTIGREGVANQTGWTKDARIQHWPRSGG